MRSGMNDLVTRQVVGQRQALGLALLAGGWWHAGVSGRAGRRRLDRLQLLQPQLQLLDFSRQPLGRLAGLHAPKPRQLDLELLDLQRGQLDGRLGGTKLGSGAGQFRCGSCMLGLQRLCEGAQFVRVGGQIDHRQRHGLSYHRPDSGQAKRTEKRRLYERRRAHRRRRHGASPVDALNEQR
jgi:hypothetical protein